MIYHIEYDIAAVFITLFMAYYIIFKKGIRRHANRVYLGMLVFNFLAEISDIFGSLANNQPEYTTRYIQDFWNYLYLSSHNVLAYVFVIYVFYLIGYEKTQRKALIFLAIPVGVDLLLLFSNPFHRQIFYYDEQGHYLHGKLFFIIYAVALAYMIYAIYMTIRHRKGISKRRAHALLFFLMITFIPVVIQIIFPEYLLTLFFETLGLMGILFTIESKEDIVSPTTGILNRYALQAALDRNMINKSCYLLLVKIPNLNYYNKMIGFENMNGILRRISKWMDETYAPHVCYDCGRGHFAVLCEQIAKSDILTIRSKTMERFERAWGKGEFSLVFPVQFGVVNIGEDVKTVENAFMLIDRPFEGKSSSDLNVNKAVHDYERGVLIERLIDKALHNKSFKVYYQPIWSRETGRINSAEALCRLIDDEYGMISPDEFIPIAERNGTILNIGQFVFEEVCRFYSEGHLQSLGIDYVEVNLSVVQCMSKNLKELFDGILKTYSLDAGCINLEITESATAENQKVLFDTIDVLKDSGFTFSLDDYGTGYSNITYMYDMPFSIIKIDKSILWKAMDPETGEGQRNAMIYIENTVRMLKDMNYAVLIEGVETIEQKKFLEDLGCDYLQGYYFSKPVPKNDFSAYLKKYVP
ncbi:MAG: EAL domain-containing protein [Clostridiales bacterium]|nr:EAL domain-containing protein [Clostridiales bacterium]